MPYAVFLRHIRIAFVGNAARPRAALRCLPANLSRRRDQHFAFVEYQGPAAQAGEGGERALAIVKDVPCDVRVLEDGVPPVRQDRGIAALGVQAAISTNREGCEVIEPASFAATVNLILAVAGADDDAVDGDFDGSTAPGTGSEDVEVVAAGVGQRCANDNRPYSNGVRMFCNLLNVDCNGVWRDSAHLSRLLCVIVLEFAVQGSGYVILVCDEPNCTHPVSFVEPLALAIRPQQHDFGHKLQRRFAAQLPLGIRGQRPPLQLVDELVPHPRFEVFAGLNSPERVIGQCGCLGCPTV